MKTKKYDIICVLSIILFMVGLYIETSFEPNGDFLFQMNRLEQMWNSIRHGHYPDFYYNDFYGLGYGSAFFYGQLTLLPFLPIYLLSPRVFYVLQCLTGLVLNYLGVRMFCKRFTKNYKQCTVMFMTSCLIVTFFSGLDLWVNGLNVGLSWFFLAYCVDFFRDAKKNSSIKATLMFFLMINTHLISSVLALIVCAILCLLYFKKQRIKDYCLFAIQSFLCCSYWIVRMLWQLDIITRNDEINKRMRLWIETSDKARGCSAYQCYVPFFGYAESCTLSGVFNSGYSFYNIFIIAFLVVLSVKNKRKHTMRERIVLCICLFVTLISNFKVWNFINGQIVDLIIQFPIRCAFYVLVPCLIVLFRQIDFENIKLNKQILTCMILLSLPEFVLFGFKTSITDSHYSFGNFDTYYSFVKDYDKADTQDKVDFLITGQLINAEYLHENFVFSPATFFWQARSVRTNQDEKLEYTIDDNVLITQVPEHDFDMYVTFPKVYYKGYRCVGENGEEFEVDKWYSQFTKVEVGDYVGELRLFYETPKWLVYIRRFNFFVLGLILGYLINGLILERKSHLSMSTGGISSKADYLGEIDKP